MHVHFSHLGHATPSASPRIGITAAYTHSAEGKEGRQAGPEESWLEQLAPSKPGLVHRCKQGVAD